MDELCIQEVCNYVINYESNCVPKIKKEKMYIEITTTRNLMEIYKKGSTS